MELRHLRYFVGRAVITVFNDHLTDSEAIVERLLPFDVVCVMRERTPLRRSVTERLPQLKLIASTGPRNAAIDVEAAAERGIVVAHRGYNARPTIEMTWALILASAGQVALESAHLRAGGWQLTMGDSLHGKTLGVLGLGNIGAEVARIGLAFGIKVTAWSQNLTADKAQICGARLVSKEELFRGADILTIHLVLSQRTKGLVRAAELQAMKPSARLINTSRGPIVDERRSLKFYVTAVSPARRSTCSTSSLCRRITRSGRWIMSWPRRTSVTSRANSTGPSMAILSRTSSDGWSNRADKQG
jgi:phosphoglycerate dehydrogenase-like enzyme